MSKRAGTHLLVTAIVILGMATAAGACDFTGTLKPGQTTRHGPVYVNFNACELEITWTPCSCPVRIGMGETNSSSLIQWSPLLVGGRGRHLFTVTAGKQYYIYVQNCGLEMITYRVRPL